MSGDSTLPLIAAHLTRLTRLDISGLTRVCSPRAFSHLPLLRRLRRLAARGCHLGQEALASVGRISSLVELDLRENVAFHALDPLAALRRSPPCLWLVGGRCAPRQPCCLLSPD